MALIRVANLKKALPFEQTPGMATSSARLAVLFEDLRIELMCIEAETITAVTQDGTSYDIDTRGIGGQYRRQYFMRRSIGTLHEFADGILYLDRQPTFQKLIQNQNAKIQRQWQKTIRFFERFGVLLEQVRNDLGGHFGLHAARFVLKERLKDSTGKIEWWDMKGIKMHFASEIAAAAYFRHIPGSTDQQRLRFLFKRIRLGYSRAIRATGILTRCYTFDRFG